MEERIQKVEDKQHSFELTLTELAGDVRHIKSRIDNGMSKTITSIYELLTPLKYAVEENSKVTGAVKKACFWVIVVAISGTIVTLAVKTFVNWIMKV